MNKITFTVAEFEREFKVGHTVAHAEIKSGRLASYKLGRRRYISGAAAMAWQQRLEAETAKAASVEAA